MPVSSADDTTSIANRVPGGAYGFVELADLTQLLSSVRGSALLDGILQSEDFARVREREWYQDFESSRKLVEFVLRMSLWEASSKLLGGRIGFAIYPAEEGDEPELALLVRPAEPSKWLKDRVWSAPLLRLGLKRIERFTFGSEVAAYRTRGKEESATYFALHSNWIAVASSESLLKSTVVLQDPKKTRLAEPGPRIGDELPYQKMTRQMGDAHFGHAFIDTQRVAALARSAGPNLGAGDDIDDPMLALFLGGVSDLLDNSRFAGFALDKKGKEVTFTTGIDARPQDVAAPYRIFFSQNPSAGMRQLPEVSGLIGGFSLYRQFGSWYRSRGEALKDSLIPGVEGFQGDIGDLLLGKTDAEGNSVIGDKVAFVAAMRDDAGAEPSGAALPGFAFVVDLANPDEADATIASIFPAVLEEIRDGKKDKFTWRHQQESFAGTQIRFAETESGGRPLAPAIARLDDRLVVSSSRLLCRDLLTALQKPDTTVRGKDLVFQLRSAPLGSLLEQNRDEYRAQMVKDGRSQRQAEDELNTIDNILGLFESIEGSTTAGDGMFQMNVTGQLK